MGGEVLDAGKLNPLNKHVYRSGSNSLNLQFLELPTSNYCFGRGVLGFKYWELALNRNLYFDSWIHELGTSVECEGCAELRKRVEELAIKVFIGLCVPEICSETEIREEVSPGALDSI